MIYTFSYKALEKNLHPDLPDCKQWDARHLRDPAEVYGHRNITGKHWAVVHYVQSQPEAGELYDQVLSHLEENYPVPDVAIGCVGGIYRSVAMAEWVSFVACEPVRHLGLELFESGVYVWKL